MSTTACVGCGRPTRSTIDATINGRTGRACGWCRRAWRERAIRRTGEGVHAGQQTYDPNEA